MAEEFVIEKYVAHMLLRAVVAVLLLAALAYPVDFAVWRTRLALSKDGRGGMGSVEVNRVVAAELKGGKEDYYFDGKMMVDCSESLYPQGGLGACWWVTRHRDVVVRY